MHVGTEHTWTEDQQLISWIKLDKVANGINICTYAACKFCISHSTLNMEVLLIHRSACRYTHQNDVIILLDLLHELLETLLKLTPLFGAVHQQTHVQGHHLKHNIHVRKQMKQLMHANQTIRSSSDM